MLSSLNLKGVNLQMKKKIIAVILAALVVVTALPFAAFADDQTDADKKVAEWSANYELLEDKLLDSDTYAHVQYVAENETSIKNTMTAYTVLGLYDGSIQNGITKNADVDTCKEILVSMIEKYQAQLGKDYVADITKYLEDAKSAAELIKKANEYIGKYTDALSFVESDTWNTVFTIVNYAIQAGKTFEEIKSGVIEAYSEIISVQMANGYYLEMLQYVADNTSYAPMKTAATELIKEATTAVNEQIVDIINSALSGTRDKLISVVIDAACDTNVYTATANKVYKTAKKVSDILFNTSDQYDLYSTLVASYYAEAPITDFVDASLTGTESEKKLFSVNALISVRTLGEEALYNLKVAQSDGIVGKIKSKLYNYVFTQYTSNMAELALTDYVLFKATDVKAVAQIAKVYCPVSVSAVNGDTKLFALPDGTAREAASVNGGYDVSVYSAYNKEYVKVAFLSDAATKTVLTGTADGYVTFVKYVLENGKVEDYSFTEELVSKGAKVTVDGLSYTAADGTVKQLNDVMVVPEGKTVTVKDVANAAGEVVKDESSSFFAKLKAIFENLFASLKKIFSFGKK